MNTLALMERSDTSLGDWAFILVCVAALVGVAGMGFVPVRIAWVRRSRWAEVVLAGVMLWGVLMAGSVIYAYMQEGRWEKERQVQIESGYFEPGDTSGKPTLPLGVWAGLMVGYGGLVALARTGGRADRETGGQAG